MPAATPRPQRCSDASAWPASVAAAERLGDERSRSVRRHRAGDGSTRGGTKPGIAVASHQASRSERDLAQRRRSARGRGRLRRRERALTSHLPLAPTARAQRVSKVHADREQRAQHADDPHRHQQDARLERARGVERDVAEPGGCRQQFRRDQSRPGIAQRDAGAGDERGQRGLADDARQDLRSCSRRASAPRAPGCRRSNRPPASSSSPRARWRR